MNAHDLTDDDHLEAEAMLAEARRQLNAKTAAHALHPIFAPILADFDRAFSTADSMDTLTGLSLTVKP